MSGPGGVGKGTIVDELVRRDPGLWLSRSWTTRAQRPAEADDAYVFTTPAAFEDRIRAGGFVEWNEFLGNYYGTPRPDHLDEPDGPDIVFEIEVNGAQQVKASYPDAVLIFVLPPSRDEQERRLRGRGDPEDKVYARLRKAEQEEPVGLAIANHVIVNDDLDRTVGELHEIIEHERSRLPGR
ncbi:MAG TPA: guanylate kinase [Ilumatobacter sp.]|nr:guanylate kinase [Ilumatobacter sp.]